MQKITTYREQSRIFLAQAREELSKGDLPQASEKGWGAAAQMLKANADARGWPHYSHRDLFRVIDELVERTGDTELVSLFSSAEFLHRNFYENGISARAASVCLHRVEQFVDQSERILDGRV